MGRPYFIGITGPSCSGKTHLANALRERLEAVVVSLEIYYHDLARMPAGERGWKNFDEPASLDSALLIAQMQQLSRGEAVGLPVYDFTAHHRTAEVRPLVPGEFVIVEGLFALYWPELRALYGTMVYVETGDALCLERRIQRDVRERGRSQEQVREQVAATVWPMAARYVHPTRAHAHLIVAGDASLAQNCSAVLDHIVRHGGKQLPR